MDNGVPAITTLQVDYDKENLLKDSRYEAD